MKRIIVCVLTCILFYSLYSCRSKSPVLYHSIYNKENNDFVTIKASKKDAFIFYLSEIFGSYVRTYYKSPRNTEDLILDIEKRDLFSYAEGVDNVYRYLKKNKDKLIIVSDSLSSSIYYKKIKDKKILMIETPDGPCVSIRRAIFSLYDIGGYYFVSDSLNDVAKFNLIEINKKYENTLIRAENELRSLKFGSSYEKIILEYTTSGLMDLCIYQRIDLDKSYYYKEIYEFLDEFAKINNISRIVMPSFVDKNLYCSEFVDEYSDEQEIWIQMDD